jgi:hypothetical protein
MAARNSAHEKLENTVSPTEFNINKQMKALVHPLPHTLKHYL